MRAIGGFLVALMLGGCGYGLTRVVPDMDEKLVGKTVVIQFMAQDQVGNKCADLYMLNGVLACVGIALDQDQAYVMARQLKGVDCHVLVGPSMRALEHELGVCVDHETYWNMRYLDGKQDR